MAEPYFVISQITNKKYDVFSVIRILNMKQAAYYMNLGIQLQDIEISQDRKTGEPIMVFYFNKEDTKEAFNEWCNRKEVEI